MNVRVWRLRGAVDGPVPVYLQASPVEDHIMDPEMRLERRQFKKCVVLMRDTD